MRIAVIGAGITGVTTALELALLQHQVTVFERRGAVATQASFALPGLVSACAPLPESVPGLQAPWQPPWLGGLGALRHGRWLWRHRRAARPAARLPREAALRALAHASRRRLGELTQQFNLAYEQQSGGLLLLTRAAQVAAVKGALAALQARGDVQPGLDLLDPAAARQREPALAAAWPLRAAVQLPSAMVGNSRQLTQSLKAQAQKLGVGFEFDSHVQRVQAADTARSTTGPSLTLAGGQTQTFDAIVICAGTGALPLLAGIGLKLPWLAPWGYAVTAPISHIDGGDPLGPRSGVLDAATGITITRLGQRVRVSEVTALGGGPEALDPARLKRLYTALEAAFPGCAVTREATHWKGPRLQLPDGAPRVGAAAGGVWLNLGHGAHGWALASGAAQQLSLLISGLPTALDLREFSPDRRS